MNEIMSTVHLPVIPAGKQVLLQFGFFDPLENLTRAIFEAAAWIMEARLRFLTNKANDFRVAQTCREIAEGQWDEIVRVSKRW